MKEEKNEFVISCWNKYKELHSDKIVYLDKIFNIFINLEKILSDFESKYKSLEVENFINPIENNKINETIKLFNKSLISFLNTTGRMMKNILTNFKEINELIKNEKEIYDNVLLNYNQYDEEKQKMNQLKNTFIDKMRVIEDTFKSKIIQNSEIKIDKKEIEDALKEYNNYKACLTEVNKKRVNFNKSQNDLLKLYQKIIIEKEGDLYQSINLSFYQVEKTGNDLTSVNVEKLKPKKKVNKIEYNKEIISQFLSKEKPEEVIELCNYNLKHKPYPISNDSTPDDIIKASQLSEEIIRKMRKYLSENFPDCNLQIQEALIQLPEIVNKYLQIDIELTDDVKNEILKLIREDMTIYPQILTVLSRLRANSKLYKSKTHIEFLGYILKEILSIAEKKKDFNAAKNCILLSQTYYIKDEKTNQKIFLFGEIKNNKWIKGSDFWRIFITNLIKTEFGRFESLYPKENLNLLNNNTNLPKKFEGRVKEILFSCLLSHVSNMMELHFDKRIVLKLLDEFCQKYQYLDDNSKNELYIIISTDQEEILKLRKEYQENPNLEKELLEEK